MHRSYGVYFDLFQKQADNLLEGEAKYSAAGRLVGNSTWALVL